MVVERLREIAHKFSGKNAIIFNEHEISYATLEEISNKLANGLKGNGIKAGDRVAVLMPNLPHFVFSYYAILKLGAIVVPINYMMEDNEFVGVLQSIEPQLIIYWEGFRHYVQEYLSQVTEPPIVIVLGNMKSIDHAELTDLIARSEARIETRQCDASETAVIQFTSGVSESPKGIELSYLNLFSNVEGFTKFFHVTDSDVSGAVLPLYFVFSQNVLMNSVLLQGGTIVLHSKLDYESIIRSIDKYKISILAGSPNLYKFLVDRTQTAVPGTSLKYCLSSWQPVPEELEMNFEQKFGRPILNCYSITETCGIVAANHPSFERRSGSLGMALPEAAIQIHNETGVPLDQNEIGEIAIQGNTVMKGYWKSTDLTSQRLKNGWYYTGDLGKIDHQQNIFLVNKKAEVIVKSGFPIYTSEIEQIIARHPKVKEVVVFATPHPGHQEDVQACIAVKDGETATSEEIIAFCREYVPVYKCPQVINFYPSLPRTKMGRIFKRKLQENFK
ncbi:MAG: AMP-binding protein [bacterium]|nr:AMP-binding protein [bacterium]